MDVLQTYGVTSFQQDIQRGKAGENIFIDDFLKFMGIKFQDVTGTQGFQVLDTDFIAKIGMYEIKMNYKDDKQIVIEEYTNVNENLSAISYGWFYKSKADVIAFISKDTRAMILVPFTAVFKQHYERIKEKYELKRNLFSERNGRRWQSAYRRVPLDAINGYFAYYKKP